MEDRIRLYLFQVRLQDPIMLYTKGAAAMFQRCPNSPMFRLPALNIKDWMENTFPIELNVSVTRQGSLGNNLRHLPTLSDPQYTSRQFHLKFAHFRLVFVGARNLKRTCAR